MIRDDKAMLYFPYPTFRENQKSLIEDVGKLIEGRANLLLVAPNGTGKTIIALSGILPVIRQKGLKLIYMCRTHAQSDRVIRELQKIDSHMKEEEIMGISLRGRTQMCLNPNMRRVSSSEAIGMCKQLRKNGCRWYRKVKQAKENLYEACPDLLSGPKTGGALIAYGKNRTLCPYYLSKYLLSEVSVVVCNYNWVLNPSILYGFLKQLEVELGDCILVIDECHNIPEVATSVSSKKIIPAMLTQCLTYMESYPHFTARQKRFIRLQRNYIENKKKSLSSGELPIDPDEFIEKLSKPLKLKNIEEFRGFIYTLEVYNKETSSSKDEGDPEDEIGKELLGAVVTFWQKFLTKRGEPDYFYCISVQKNRNRKYGALEVVSLDARVITVPLYRRCYASLNLSGTITPRVFTNLTGLNYSFKGKQYRQYTMPSPFPARNILALITEGVSTKNESRTPPMFRKYVDKIGEIVKYSPGNVGIFCASYAILNSLLMYGLKEALRKAHKKMFTEESSLSASENAYMVDDFKSCGDGRGAVLLGVCGGRNAEGEDFPGAAMNTVLIVGIPYLYPSPRIKAKIEYYDRVFRKKGWLFGYLSPAMQKANQASGRPIRKLTDKGAIIFMDGRFAKKTGWVAPWVSKLLRTVPDEQGRLGEVLTQFWNA
jgi:DNA excision repair protein ERCC-2